MNSGDSKVRGECVPQIAKAEVADLVPRIDGGHFAFMTDGEQLLDALVTKVRPVVIARGA
jgi:hypothetical protein